MTKLNCYILDRKTFEIKTAFQCFDWDVNVDYLTNEKSSFTSVDDLKWSQGDFFIAKHGDFDRVQGSTFKPFYTGVIDSISNDNTLQCCHIYNLLNFEVTTVRVTGVDVVGHLRALLFRYLLDDTGKNLGGITVASNTSNIEYSYQPSDPPSIEILTSYFIHMFKKYNVIWDVVDIEYGADNKMRLNTAVQYIDHTAQIKDNHFGFQDWDVYVNPGGRSDYNRLDIIDQQRTTDFLNPVILSTWYIDVYGELIEGRPTADVMLPTRNKVYVYDSSAEEAPDYQSIAGSELAASLYSHEISFKLLDQNDSLKFTDLMIGTATHIVYKDVSYPSIMTGYQVTSDDAYILLRFGYIRSTLQSVIQGIIAGYQEGGTKLDAASQALKSYPVGSVYLSYTPSSPALVFGGVWTTIEDGRFLRAGRDSSIGGSDTHNHTMGHTHDLRNHTHTSAAHAHNISGGQTAGPAATAWAYVTMGGSVSNMVVRGRIAPTPVNWTRNRSLTFPGSDYNTTATATPDAAVVAGATNSATPGSTGGPSVNSTGAATNSTTTTVSNVPRYQTLYAWRRISDTDVPPDAQARGVSGGCTWYITADNDLSYAGRLVIFPTNGISGTLETYASASDVPWNANRSKIRSVYVEFGTSAGEDSASLFADLPICTEINAANMYMSDALGTISRWAYNNPLLTSLNIPETFGYASDDMPYAMASNPLLESIIIPEGFGSRISDGSLYRLFYGNSSLTSIILPSAFGPNATGSSSGMFAGCTSITEIDLGGLFRSEASPSTDMFLGCDSLDKITVGSRFRFSPDGLLPARSGQDPQGRTYTGRWVAQSTGESYAPSEIPPYTEDTYTAEAV